MKLLVKVENININQILDYINNNFIRLVDMKFNVGTSVVQSEKIDVTSTIIYTLVFESSRETNEVSATTEGSDALKKLFGFLTEIGGIRHKINVMDYCWLK